MLNHISLMGRLTRDPELKKTPSDVSVCTVTLACDRDFADKATGERDCDFVDVVAWRGTADFLARNFSRGRMAVVSGRLQMRKWTDKDGNKRVSAEIVADNIYFGDSKRENAQSNGYSHAAPPAPAGADFAAMTDDDGDMPF